MVAEFKASNIRVPFVPRALPLVTGNSDLRLRISEDRDAWKRRLLILRVSKPAARSQIPGFAEQLIREEGSGILRLVVDSARRLLAEGMPSLSEEQNRRVDTLLNASDPFREFVQLHVVRKRGGKLYTGEAYKAARAFLRRNHHEIPGEQKLQQAVQAAMKQELPTVRLSKSLPNRADMSARGWRGVRLREPHEVSEA